MTFPRRAAALAVAALALTGCTTTPAPRAEAPTTPAGAAATPGTTIATPAVTATRAARTVTVPAPARDEVARLVLNAATRTLTSTVSGETTGHAYTLDIVCTAPVPHSVTIRLRDASTGRQLDDDARNLGSVTATCDGSTTTTSYEHTLPAATVQLLADDTTGVTGLYAILHATR